MKKYYQSYFERHAMIWQSYLNGHISRAKREQMLSAMRNQIPTIEKEKEDEQAKNT